ncbi:geranylgeranylglycerol-phosphate geranylgeranyltransferase [Aquimarina sp. ERC-38]|uniref:geranylgeranylglycerol-phosphate geranylgeranyltransferase n=1 Tax=Aquimarina sp. ERC-38 TaxID=2949996 RepID=UPI00224537E0|nr:geranylgeranylglycerol-phosphate geranylgeranyltransferase [Aquimarina sp. ERC-38]UZO81501.1 geranylgeranylglycerol-phosphate geranylgeranyltransferase [Aquimarina sp. ERC-38]
MLSRKNKVVFLKLISLFSLVRGYNIVIIVLAQYLTAVFILAPELPLSAIFLDDSLFSLILASAISIAGGYIINDFYDKEKDLINRPNKYMLDHLISQRTQLTVYFILNFLAVIIASYVSFKAVLFFSIYIFAIWLYSHKLKKYAIIGNIAAALLAITPFFAVFIYYKNFDKVIFVHAVFLFLILLIREMMKDLSNIKGDLVQNYQTVPVIYGEKVSKIGISMLVALSLIPIYLLLQKFDLGYMVYYFYASIGLLLFFLVGVWKSESTINYVRLHNILKLIIVVGALSIVLIDPYVIINRIPKLPSLL